jgi:cytosine deaminase
LEASVENFTAYVKSIPEGQLKYDIKKRARQVANMVVQAGTTAFRTHANVETSMGLQGIEALNELKEEIKDYVDVQITALPTFYDGPEEQKKRFELLDYACSNKMIDYLGGAPHLHENCRELTEKIFAVAVKYGLPIDLHVDESDHPNVENFEHVAELTMKYGYEGRVSCGHVTALNAVDDETAAKAIAKAKKANLHIITLPSCNLYLMGRTDKQPIRRGVTRIREFLEAGVNISFASDNIRDPFRPIGNGDMLEEGLITAQVAQMLMKSELEQVFDMGTINPAKALSLSNYGLAVGRCADFVIMEAETKAEALINQATRRYVIKNGRVVAKTLKTTQTAF